MTRNHSEFCLAPGQRWMSEAEPELGMGILVFYDKRSIKIEFPGGDCTRQYSMGAAPIRRVRFKTGDRITRVDGRQMRVETIKENDGALTYVCCDTNVPESDLSPFMAASLPQERLLAGLCGPGKEFELRRDIRFQLGRYQSSLARGFLGGQVDLIPHQLYIAGQVSRRYFPRVMLSDETGLGKTIEAGLILHRLLILEQIGRVLIIVPDTLVHQWFIELYRKFNFKFRLFNETHCLEALQNAPGMNPFSGDQQGICSQTFIQNPKFQDLILKAGWDMVVMDEAHHIADSPELYSFMQKLGSQTRGLMLLSATPEQMGPRTHFAQLQLLDPARYHDETAYSLEAKIYEKTARSVQALLSEGKPVDSLLDTFGPGRVVFRNRRASIQGFAKRKVILLPLEGKVPNAQTDLTHDPRTACLAELVKTVKPEKILVICSSAKKAHALERAVQTHIAVDIARFDETMSLLQRDRQAAWFAREKGARLLICSEIGSEGRNFQFVNRLFLFDLPENPELLEQRIGRVDRIGQKKEIRLYVPYIKGYDQEILARWYSDGLSLLEQNINGLHAIFSKFASRLNKLLSSARQNKGIHDEKLTALIADASRFTRGSQSRLDRGKHILLELNSFRPGPAKDLVRAVTQMDRDPGLQNLMENLLDHYGVDMDIISEKKGDHLISLTMDRTADEAFPALPRGSETVTFDRTTAIGREEITFLTWDHPFVNQVVDFFLTHGEGMAAAARYEGDLGPGLFLETLYLLEIPGVENIPGALQFIQPEPIHILINHLGQQPDSLPQDFYNSLKPDRPWFMDMEEIKTKLIPNLLAQSLELAETMAERMRAQAVKSLNTTLGREIHRLEELKRVNPDITDREIDAARTEKNAIGQHLSGARVRLDAIRLIRTE